MKAGIWMAGMLCVADMAVAAPPADSPDSVLCRGTTPVMLMTEMECRVYAERFHRLQAQGDVRALEMLRQEHDGLMAERAATCPCASQPPGDAKPTVVAGDC